MNYLSLAIKNILKSKVITAVSILLITAAIILFNSTFSSIRGMFSELIFAKGFDDEALYVVEPNYEYYESFLQILSTEESDRHLEMIFDNYCKEMNLPFEKGSSEYYSLFYEYDCMTRWVIQHMEELGEKTLYPIYDKFKTILDSSGLKYQTVDTYKLGYDNVFLKDYMGFNLSVISDEMADRINMNIITGKDLKNTNSHGDIIEAVAMFDGDFSNDVKVGDCFDISFFNFTTNEYETKTIKIAGIMGSPFYDFVFYSSYVAEDKTKLENLISRNVIDYKKNATSFRLYIKPFDGFNENIKGYNASYGYDFTSFYFTLDNPSDDELNNLKRELVTAGYDFTSVKAAYDNTFNEVKNTVLADSVILFISIFLSLITICGTIILYITDNIRTHYIYMLCGAKLKDHIMVCLTNIFINCIISVGLSTLYLYIQNVSRIKKFGEVGELFGITYDHNNVYLTLLLIIIILIVTWLISSKMFRFTMYKGRENAK